MPSLPITHHPQRQQADCLAACAAMVLGYYQINLPYDQIIQILRIGDAGAPFSNLNFLQSIGVTVEIAQGNLATLHNLLTSGEPPVAFILTGPPYWTVKTNHAVVVTGMDEQAIYLNDPMFPTAPHRIPLAEFDLAWVDMDEFYAVIRPNRSR